MQFASSLGSFRLARLALIALALPVLGSAGCLGLMAPAPPDKIWQLDGSASAVAFSPDGETLAVAGGWDCKANVTLWDIDTGKRVGNFDTGYPVSDVVFSPDGKYLATSGLEDNLSGLLWLCCRDLFRMCDPTRGPFGSTPTEQLMDLQMSVTGRSSTIDLATSKQVEGSKLLDPWDRDEPHAVVSADGNWRATISDNGEVNIRELTSGKKSALKTESKARKVAFSADGRYLVTVSENTAIVWDWPASKQKFQIPGLVRSCGVAVSPHGSLLAVIRKTSSEKNELQLWDMELGHQILLPGRRNWHVAE